MTLADKIKQLISEELTYFLISNDQAPIGIEIKIQNNESSARLIIDAEKISEALKQ
jgi:hypothetical protein